MTSKAQHQADDLKPWRPGHVVITTKDAREAIDRLMRAGMGATTSALLASDLASGCGPIAERAIARMMG